MSRRHIGLAVAMVMVFSSFFFALIALPTAQAAPIFLEENFSTCTLGENPTGWSASSSSNLPGFICSSDWFEPYTNSLYVWGRNPAAIPGTVTSPSFDTLDASSFSVGFSLLYTVQPTTGIFGVSCYDPISVIVGGASSAAGICIGQDGVGGPIPNELLYLEFLGASSFWVNTGIVMPNETWYDFRFDIRPDLGTTEYDLSLNGTVIATNIDVGTWTEGGWTAGELRAHLVGNAEYYIDSILVGAPTITPLADATTCLNQVYGIAAGVDAEVVWTMSGAPTGITIGPASGIIDGTPTTEGDFTVSVTATTTAGSDTEEYTLTVEACGGGRPNVIIGGGVWGHADYEIDDDDPCVVGDLELTFMDKSVDPRTVLIYIWDFGEGGRPIMTSSPNVSHTFLQTGTYTVTLAIMLSDGSALRQEQEVDVGLCAVEFNEAILNLLAALAATATILWLVFVFTRRRPIMIAALITTLVAVSGWTLLVGF